LAVVTAARWDRARDRIWGAPNVIVEIIDKRRARRTRTLRVRWYRDFGVQECWLLDARVQRVEVLDLQRRRLPYIYSMEAEFSSRVLRGFRMPVSDIFPDHGAARPEGTVPCGIALRNVRRNRGIEQAERIDDATLALVAGRSGALFS
jgi:hypothetical protein